MPNISKELIQFCSGKTDLLLAFQDYYAENRAINDNIKLFSYNTGISYDEKSAKISKLFFSELENRSGIKRSDNEEAWASNPNVKWAAFALIDAMINSVLPLTINPSIGIFTDLKFVSYGDAVHFKVLPRTLYTVSDGGYGERTSFRQLKSAGDIMLYPKEHIVTVYTDMYSVLAGKQDIADFVRLVAISIETRMTTDAITALTTGMAVGTYPAQLSIQGAFSKDQMITLAETVQAYNYGVKPVILGTATALSKVIPDSSLGFRMEVLGNNGSVGIMKDYYGYTLMQLPQVATGDYTNYGLAVAPDTVYVVSPSMDKLIKGVISNSLTNSNQFYENADITQNFTMRKAWDFMLASAAVGGLYKITD